MAVDPVTGFPIVTEADLAEHTEQALIQLVYVQTANDMIGSAMANLDRALHTTQSVLNILQALQNLHNQVGVKSKSAFPFLFSTGGVRGKANTMFYIYTATISGVHWKAHGAITGFPDMENNRSLDPSSYMKSYQAAASAYFGKAIDPFFVFANDQAPGFANFRDNLMSLKTRLNAEIQALTVQSDPGASADPGTLLFNILKVFRQLPSNNTFAAIEKWALDSYNQHASTGTALAGQLQNNLTFAITAAENLNDTQKEKVRRFLFIFQEYYQSAAAVLSAIHQVINQMAQKISQ